jgi:hypothetical protein
LLIAEFFILRHLKIFVFVPNRFYEQTGIGISRDNRWPGIAARQQRFTGIQPKTGPLFRGTVALKTVRVQQRPHFLLKILQLLLCDLSRLSSRFVNKKGKQQRQDHWSGLSA